MIGYGNPGDNHDFEAFNAAGQVCDKDTLIYENYVAANYLQYRIPANETGGSNTTGEFTADTPADATRYKMRVRGATLALSYVVWVEDLEIKLKTDLIGTLRSLIRW